MILSLVYSFYFEIASRSMVGGYDGAVLTPPVVYGPASLWRSSMETAP